MIVCTTATLSHVPYAMEMAKSLRKHISNVKIVLGLVEEEVPNAVSSSVLFDQIILAKNLSIPNFNRFMFKLTVPLSQNSIKAQLLHHLFETDRSADIVVYVDCFTYFCGPIPEAIHMLDHYPIVVTPHLIDVHFTDAYEREMSLLNDGTFFGGFIALKRSDEAKDFLLWWSDKLNRDIRDPYASNFFDQKWLNFANVFFNAGILRHSGYQVGFWNFYEQSREIESQSNNSIMLKGGPLRLMNFGNENNNFDLHLDSLSERQSMRMQILRNHYQTNINSHDSYGLRQHAVWSYGSYQSGEKIADEARIKFRDLHHDHVPANPFELSNRQIMSTSKGADHA
ncbi:hypothetical protein E0485_00495 [Paenibacillus albiflavus]|uniref:Glycosyl transferase n=1 Tax=Paenibacillus albiflavus TaxID=2545760 RepID=A0A4R4EQW7_9BACL|nr:hypothetical protein [Paenibacillus albiflavus]TCZ80808.1 hypothetical protein E0485_00495 [Paenibacillus albiflavus]